MSGDDRKFTFLMKNTFFLVFLCENLDNWTIIQCGSRSIIMIVDVGLPPTPRSQWAAFWSSYLGLRTFTNQNGYDSVSSFKRRRVRKQSCLDPYFAVTLMTIGMVAFVALKLVEEGVEPQIEFSSQKWGNFIKKVNFLPSPDKKLYPFHKFFV